MPLGDEATSRGSAPCRSRPWARTQCRRTRPLLPLTRRLSGPPGREDSGGCASLGDSRRMGAGRAVGRDLPGGESSLRSPQVGSGQVRELLGHHTLGVVIPPREACGKVAKPASSAWRLSQSSRQRHESPRPRAAPQPCQEQGPPAGATLAETQAWRPRALAARVGLTRVSAKRSCPTRTVPAGAQTPLTPCAHRHPGAPREGRSPACGRQGRPRCETIISGPHVLYLGADYIIFILKCYDKEPYL